MKADYLAFKRLAEESTDAIGRIAFGLLAHSYAPCLKRGRHLQLQGRVLGTALQQGTSFNVAEATNRIRKAGIQIERHQVEAYFRGRYTPQHKVVVSLSTALDLPDLRTLSTAPWGLLSTLPLSSAAIDEACELAQRDAAGVFRNEHMEGRRARGQSI